MSTSSHSGAHITICTQSLQHNIAQIKAHCPRSKILAVIKANAYGHGLEDMAKALVPLVDGLGVARIEEAVRVREAGVDQLPLVVLSPTKSVELFRQCMDHKLDVVLQHEQELDMLNTLPNSQQLRVWLKVDTGLRRLGFGVHDYPQALRKTLDSPQVSSVIPMTHFSSAADVDLRITRAQLQEFLGLDHSGTEGLSSANSAALARLSETHLDWVRPGLLSYGVNPEPKLISNLDLKPVMTFSAPIIAIREIPHGAGVGYGHLWHAPRKSLIATVGAGYADGYPCFDKGSTPYAYLHETKVPLVGQVSMDMLALDITQCPQAKVGDQVELWGKNITANEVSVASKRRLYTLLTGISERVSKVYR